MSEQPNSPQQPRRMATPAANNARREALAIGAGGLALIGAAAAGLATMRGDNPGPQPPPDGEADTPLKLAEPLLGSPTPRRSATPSAGSSPSTTPSEGIIEYGAQPSESNPSQPQSTARRVLHDPVDDEMPAAQQVPEQVTANGENVDLSRLARIEASAAYQAPPPEPTLSGSSAFAPGITLETTPAWHLARRASLGASTALAAEIEAMGTTAWIDQQLAPEDIDDGHAEEYIRQNFSWSLASAADIAQTTDQTFKVGPQVINALLTRARFGHRHLAENVIETLANHVYVPAQGKAPEFAGEYDQLLRQHALGKYSDLLYALVTHPALLVELDNQVNTSKNPNENLGRELLELYTVGVDHFNEDDVHNSALLLSGHGVDWDTHRYVYQPRNHHLGALRIMEFSDANTDAAQAPHLLRRYLDYLTRHQGTARRLAHRFAVRFISDEPNQATVEELAQVYLEHDTSIKALVRATLTHPDFTSSTGKKWRRPGELINAISRAAQVFDVTPKGRSGGGEEYNYGLYGWLISTARDLPRNWPMVNGYPDTAQYWNSASFMLQVLNGTQDAVIGDQEESGTTSWSQALSIKPGDDAMTTAERITWHLTGYRWPADLVNQLATLMLGTSPGPGLPDKDLDHWLSQAVRVIFASPYAFLR